MDQPVLRRRPVEQDRPLLRGGQFHPHQRHDGWPQPGLHPRRRNDAAARHHRKQALGQHGHILRHPRQPDLGQPDDLAGKEDAKDGRPPPLARAAHRGPAMLDDIDMFRHRPPPRDHLVSRRVQRSPVRLQKAPQLHLGRRGLGLPETELLLRHHAGHASPRLALPNRRPRPRVPPAERRAARPDPLVGRPPPTA